MAAKVVAFSPPQDIYNLVMCGSGVAVVMPTMHSESIGVDEMRGEGGGPEGGGALGGDLTA